MIIDIENWVSSSARLTTAVNKKTMFTIMNFVLPEKGQLSMHCSANVGDRGDTAILFGLSGTGKTTLSAGQSGTHRRRRARVDRRHLEFRRRLLRQAHRSRQERRTGDRRRHVDKGTLIENVPALPGKAIADTDPQEFDLTDGSITENTRFAYPLDTNPNVREGAAGPHPETIVLLTADAFGVLPPVSILDGNETMYHFVMGFTSKLAGTEVGVTEPEPSFSSCFGRHSCRRSPPSTPSCSPSAWPRTTPDDHAQHRLDRGPLRQG